ncbi:MAG: aminotransferase class IV [Flavobacteriaceae bacterium]|nr:aminotransferase class IV [Flavobacteriaceae bacterium]
MENFNGNIFLNVGDLSSNRAFKYGDALFDTLKYSYNKIEFLEDHYFRLMASMRLLRMKIPMNFTLEFYEEAILKTIDFSLNSDQFRIRVTIFRKNGGFYLPTSNDINYLIETAPLIKTDFLKYEVDIFKDYFISSSLLSTIKTSNRLINVLASIYAGENQLQNCLLLNEYKQIVEAINGNIFVVKENQIVTPPLSEGCINGIYRKKLIELVKKQTNYDLIETPLIYTDLLNASEVFMTNSIIGIQPITHFKKKIYQSEIALILQKLMLKNLI